MNALNEILNRIILQVWGATGVSEQESMWDEEMVTQRKDPEENNFDIDYQGNRYQVIVRKII